MHRPSILSQGVTLLSLAALVWLVVPGKAQTGQPAWQDRPAGSSIYLLSPVLGTWIPSGVGSGTISVVGLPSSVIPSQPAGASCSVEATPAADNCSTSAGVRRCSAQCEADQRCSVSDLSGNGTAQCSTGPRNSRCSVLQPSFDPPAGSSNCSTFGGTTPGIRCSTRGRSRRQACSAENPSLPVALPSQCSTIDSSNSVCSVFNSSSGSRGFCSTGFAGGNKTCSIFVASVGCSVVQGGKGTCTALRGAPAGSCSAFSLGGCSVIGGNDGVLCRQP